MRPVNEKLAADLLEAGKQEFLEKGFQGASMRGIASRPVSYTHLDVYKRQVWESRWAPDQKKKNRET